MEFPFACVATRPFDSKIVDFHVASTGKKVTIVRSRNTPDDAIYAELGNLPKTASGNAALLVNEATGAGIRLSGDRCPSIIRIWGTVRVVCPELFVPIVLFARQTMRWSTQYTFESGIAPK